MLISKTFHRINQCLELSESLNLSNNEEERITLELLNNFKKLLILILSKKEKQNFKQKVNLIKKITDLETLKSKIKNPNKEIKWQSTLPFKTNMLLKTNEDFSNLNYFIIFMLWIYSFKRIYSSTINNFNKRLWFI